MDSPNGRVLTTALLAVLLFGGVIHPAEAAGFSDAPPIQWTGGLIHSIQGFFDHLFIAKEQPAPAKPNPSQQNQTVLKNIVEKSPTPVMNITQIISVFGNGLTLVSPYGDIFPKDGLTPALGTSAHPFSQLNLELSHMSLALAHSR